MTERALSPAARLYLATVILAGTSIAVLSVVDVSRRDTWSDWIALALLTLITGSFTVKIPGVLAKFSISDAFVFASVLIFGPSVATVIVSLDTLVATFWIRPENRSLVRSLFNLASAAIAIWTASHAFYWLADAAPGQPLQLSGLLIPLFTLAALYFIINSWLVAFVLGFERHVSAFPIWWRSFPWLSLNYFGGVSVAATLVAQSRSIDISTLTIIFPILLITYLTYKTSHARLSDAERHVAQVNELYLSTIEALAMAVDAKDQITHGHIRRVQVFAIELAKRLGVSDDRHVKAIETAALLHDMGKLAIPEHILNKPGKLTPAEFEKMKSHANLGADLLSSIRFPYPVVPIVRHHHESWDGSGYPAGIVGTDIPLGARILSVVDCFDALTSDRPYRPRLSNEDAFAILLERRGSMYDPLVVDTFIKVFNEIAPLAIKAGQLARSMTTLPGKEPLERRLKTTSADSHLQTLLLGSRAADDSVLPLPEEAVRKAVDLALTVAPASVCAYYSYQRDSDTVRCVRAAGEGSERLLGHTIPSGERITGWVAANGRPAINSDAYLDLGTLREGPAAPLSRAISFPIVARDSLVGVLTTYSRHGSFGDGHVAALRDLAESLAAAVEPDVRPLEEPPARESHGAEHRRSA